MTLVINMLDMIFRRAMLNSLIEELPDIYSKLTL